MLEMRPNCNVVMPPCLPILSGLTSARLNVRSAPLVPQGIWTGIAPIAVANCVCAPAVPRICGTIFLLLLNMCTSPIVGRRKQVF